MIAIDTQLLVYAHRPEYAWHERARSKIAEIANASVRWAIPLHCIVEFYANVTNPKLYKSPSTVDLAIEQIELWRESPTLTILSEDGETWRTLRDLLVAGKIVGAAGFDARIAAVCLQHGVTELWTNDRDFLRYPTLRVRNTLVEPHGAAEPPTRYRVDRSRSRKRSRAA